MTQRLQLKRIDKCIFMKLIFRALAKQLRTMSFEKFFELLQLVYITILHILQRISISHKLIASIIRDAKEKGLIVGMESLKTLKEPISPTKLSPLSPTGRSRRKTFDEDDDLDGSGLDQNSLDSNQWAPSKTIEYSDNSIFETLIMESANVLASASDLAHVRCAKLIGVRSEQNAMINPNDFFRLFGATWEFVYGAESITGRLCFGLKGTMLSQVFFLKSSK
jgi:hypothetical protein